MVAPGQGRYKARFSQTPQDVLAAQKLRYRAFCKVTDPVDAEDAVDADQFDDICTHVLVEETGTGALVCCFRILPLSGGDEIGRSYSAQHYDLSALQNFTGPMVEMGRFCITPGRQDPDILRVAWAAMTRFVDDSNVELLFGCSSFAGTNAEKYQDAFAMLQARHLAPMRWRPRVKASQVIQFAPPSCRQLDAKQAMQRMPPLLRTYLLMGGWVSDHAVVDAELNTLHVFTGLEIRAIPAGRKRFLRAISV